MVGKKDKYRKTYHAYQKNEEDKYLYLKKLIYSLLVSKQRFEVEFLKLKLRNQEFKKFLEKIGSKI
jgi:hypothetical protein